MTGVAVTVFFIATLIGYNSPAELDTWLAFHTWLCSTRDKNAIPYLEVNRKSVHFECFKFQGPRSESETEVEPEKQGI